MNGRWISPRLLVPTLAVFLVSGCEESGPTEPVGGRDDGLVGSIQVATVTTGSTLDPDGYIFTVDGGEEQSIGVNETITFTGLEEGDHEVSLTGLTSNCAVTSANPQTVVVVAGETASTRFEVTCEFVDLTSLGMIAFVRGEGDDSDIWVMEGHGGNPAPLTGTGDDPAFDDDPAWSPDGMKIAFTRGDPFFDDFPVDVWVMDAHGLNLVNLTHNNSEDFSPTWSPDGKKIAFTRLVGGKGEIFVMDADGSNLVNLTNNQEADDSGPAWSPDGSQIAFSSYGDGNAEVYVMDADGSNPVNLTNDRAFDSDPAWSPDGTKIAFTHGDAFFDDFPGDVWVMDADGSNLVNLTNNQEADDSGPAWSPDGTKIAFSTDRDGNREVYVMDADGSNPVNLTNRPGFDGEPAWAPSP